MTAIHALLDGLIDYAGLFPPASLNMQTAVRNYASYRTSEHAYALGRFVVPVQRLEEFAAAFNEECCYEQGAPWLLSVLCTDNPEADRDLLAINEGAMFIDAAEVKAKDAAHATSLVNILQSGESIYVEFPLEQSDQVLPVLKKLRAKAKVRTGGVTPDAFPETDSLAHFVFACAKERVAFKATAGLHHPLRSVRNLTYEPDSTSTMMHGFINVFIAAIIAYFGSDQSEINIVLNEQNGDAFQWTHDSLIWRGHQISSGRIREARDNFAISFGSCSFIEPIDDLKAMGWL